MEDGVGEQLAARLAFMQHDPRQPRDMHRAERDDGEADDGRHRRNLLGLDA